MEEAIFDCELEDVLDVKGNAGLALDMKSFHLFLSEELDAILRDQI
jgi:hypothetical protein